MKSTNKNIIFLWLLFGKITAVRFIVFLFFITHSLIIYSQVPVIETVIPTNISKTGCISGGNITNPNGTISSVGVCWSTSANPTVSDNKTNNGITNGFYNSIIPGSPLTLIPNTLYHVRAYAINENGIGYGVDQTFTTLSNSLTATVATSVTATSFTANWTTPIGGGSETFTYTIIVSPNPDCSSPVQTISGIASGTLSQAIAGLTSGVNYYYSVFVVNAGGNSALSNIITMYPSYAGGNFDGGTVTSYYINNCLIPDFNDMYFGGSSSGYISTNLFSILCSYMYYGGDGRGDNNSDGSATNCLLPDISSVYLGGIEDGFSDTSLIVQKCPYSYFGGDYDGGTVNSYSTNINCLLPSYTDIYHGGDEDGYSDTLLLQIRCPYNYYGGEYDGSIVNNYNTNTNCLLPSYTDIYHGGTEDGYADSLLLQIRCPVFFYGGNYDGQAVCTAYPSCEVVDFTVDNDSICPGQVCNFTDLSSMSGGPGTNYPTKWLWSFEGGYPSTSTQQNPSVAYRRSGLYKVSLTVGNDSSGYKTVTKLNYIFVGLNPTATIDTFGSTNTCQCQKLILSANNGSSYSWSPTGETTQSITVTQSGTYTVTVDGCYVVKQPVIVNINPNPKKPVISTDGFIQSNSPDSGKIILSSSPSTSYKWVPTNKTTQSDTISLGNNNFEGNYYVIGYDANGCSDSSSVVRVQVDKNGPCDVALKVDLLSMFGMPYNNKWIYIKWVSASETNNDHYTLERSKNSKEYEEITTIKGAGNSSSPISYSFYDKEPYFGTSYYRLKQTDFDGKSDYVGFIIVRLFPRSVSILKVYPNPVSNLIKYDIINNYDSLKLTISITDLLGRNIKNQDVTLFSGDNHNIINVNELESGLYFLNFTTMPYSNTNDKKNIFTWKFVKE
ncbi:MAG: T9SS type A sorting domain-containing protein [Bacteroidota bacterium]|nr:T9SS type A sorting domain-containing protein [Bacteroidota bacterium]